MHEQPDHEDDLLIRQYLLGRLAPPQREQVETRIFSDSGYGERVELAEADLLEEYAEGVLPEDERRDFAARYLATPRLRLEVRTIEELRRRAAADEPVRTAEPHPRWDWLVPLRRHFKPLLATGFALLVVAVAALILLHPGPQQLEQRLLYGRSPRADLEREVARLNTPRDEAEALAAREARASAGPALELAPGVQREAPNGEDDALLVAREGSAYARLRLKLDPAAGKYQSFQVSFKAAEGGEFEANLMPSTDGDGRFLDVTLPVAQLPEGEYQIQLYGRADSGRLEELPGHYYRLQLIRRPR